MLLTNKRTIKEIHAALETTVGDMKVYLTDLKQKCDESDNLYFNIPDKIQYVQNMQNMVFRTLSDYWAVIWDELKDLDYETQDYLQAREYLSRELLGYFRQGLLNKRVCDKPEGFNGDFLTIYYYFLDYMGDSIYEILINQYSRSLPSAVAHKNRFSYLKQRFSGYARRPGARILSLGAGPAVEVLQFSAESPREFEKINFTFLDFDEAALGFIKKRLGDRENVSYLHYPIMEFLKDVRRADLNPGSYDFIYCFGLLDYLDNSLVGDLFASIYSSLSHGGKAVFTNVHRDITERAYFELLGGRKMFLRDETELLELTPRISTGSRAFIDRSVDESDNVYYCMEK